jgi:hypothetical protein
MYSRLLPLALLLACESVEPSGSVFSPVAPPEKPEAPAPPADPEWEIPKDLPAFSSEELQKTGTSNPATDLFGNPVSGEKGNIEGAPSLAAAAPIDAPVPPKAPPATGQRSDPWPVRLLATLPDAQPPRAIVGLANGEEKVVAPGSILAEQGLVVMSISDGTVELARITPAGDHAQIDSVQLSAQYAVAPTVEKPARKPR